MLGFAGTVGVDFLVDVFQRVGGTGVLGQGHVGVVGGAGLVIDDDVFQYRAELDGVPDHRLVLLAQVDALGVAATFDIEHHVLAPAVLVVTDQVTGRVGGQGGLAGAGQTEEQGHVAVFAHVGRAVHRQHVFFRQQEVLHGEHGFLHFTGVTHAGDKDLALGEVEDHTAVGVGAVTLRLALEVRGVQDLPLFLAARVVLLRADEHGVGEQVVPRGLRGHFYGQVMISVGAHVQVGDKGISVGHGDTDTIPEGVELVSGERTVDGAPVDVLAGAGLINDVAVHGGTAGAMTGFHYQGAGIGQAAFVALNSQFYQLGRAEVVINNRVGHGHSWACGRAVSACMGAETLVRIADNSAGLVPVTATGQDQRGPGDETSSQHRRAIMPEKEISGDSPLDRVVTATRPS